MLKFEGKFPVGQYIRAYDFEPCKGRADSYLEGKIVELHTVDMNRLGDFSCYIIAVETECTAGKITKVDGSQTARIPYQVSMSEYDHRIIPV